MRALPRALVPAIVAATLAGCGSTSSGDNPQRLIRGRDHYVSTCARCHQPNGAGYDQIYPNLAGNPIVKSEDPEAVIAIVLHGRGSMPAFGERPPEELAEIITYIRYAWGNGAGAVTPSQVK